MKRILIRHLLGAFFLCLITSCAYKKNDRIRIAGVCNRTPLFISMPDNVMEHMNISSELYNSLWNHFSRVGYNLSSMQDAQVRLEISRFALVTPHKFISPDLVVYGKMQRFEAHCRLVSSDSRVLAESTVTCLALMSSPRSPMLRSSYSAHDFEKMFDRLAVKVSQWVQMTLNEHGN